LLANLTEAVGYISSPTAIKKFGDEYGSNPVGAGPFQLDEWRRDSKLALKRFEGYWRQGLPLAPALTYQPIPDTAVKLTNLKSNAIDIVDEIDTKDADAVSRDNTLTLHALPGSRWPMIRLNCAKPPFDNMALRQAVAYAINKDTLAKGAFFGRAQPAYGAISPLYKSYYDPGIDKIGLAYDPAKAKEKLAAAGMPQGFSFQLDTGGTPDRIRQAELIQNDLAAVGIKMEVRTMDSAAFTDRLRSKQFDAALGSWTPRPDVEGIIHPHFHSKGLSNWVSYNNPKVDELLDKARTAPNGPERIDLYKQVERIVAVEVPWAFLVFEELTRAARAPLQGYKLTPDTLLWLQEVSVPDRR
jgi:peptide/nickel transport system substrate-binding protein